MRPIRGWWLLVAVLLLGLLAPSAWASDPALAEPKEPTARKHFTHGNRLYRIRKFDEAIAEYQTGAVIELAPVFDYNLGQCYRQLGKYKDAIWHYERFLKNGRPGPELHALVTNFLRQMQAELDRKAMSQPPTEVASETSPTRGAARRSQPSAPGDPVTSVAVRSEARWYSDGTGWALTAGGCLGGGVAGYLLASAAGFSDEAGRTSNEGRRIELRDASRTRTLAGAAVGVGSLGLIAVGVIKLAVSPTERSRSGNLSWSIGAFSDGAYVFGRF
jgi:tetratricopeptide (TPR) repeat protein